MTPQPKLADAASPNAPLLEMRALGRDFTRRPVMAERLLSVFGRAPEIPLVRAVRSVDLSVRQGEVLGLVGESGCGKSTLGRMISGITPPSRGSVHYDGQPVARLGRAERRAYTLGVQMIFQDPYASLNPRQRVGDILSEPLRVHGIARSAAEVRATVDAALSEVGLDPAFRDRYPHQFSGGQRQRIGIARALIVQPQFLVCDEPIAALDVSVQAQVINLFLDLRQRRKLTYLFISHDLSVVRHMADRVAIMYLGDIVELAPADVLFSAPAHPYTRTLLEQIPSVRNRKRKFEVVRGELPSPLAPPPGCPFHPRCQSAMPRCSVEAPALRRLSPDHTVSCHLHDEDQV